ncbi:MAG TPA: hypothetical protein VFX76_12215, partial [Roseiflexaceae bacterium]|nr:hypothetical protein [Roseiflexaceae bacterium]
EKLTLQRAAVIGRVFFDRALQVLDHADDSHVADLPRVLHDLAAHGFIERHETSSFADTVEYSFTQAMLRDLIAETLVSRQRQIYHRAAADWLAGGERAGEYAVLIAEHYEQASGADRSTAQLHAKQ